MAYKETKAASWQSAPWFNDLHIFCPDYPPTQSYIISYINWYKYRLLRNFSNTSVHLYRSRLTSQVSVISPLENPHKEGKSGVAGGILNNSDSHSSTTTQQKACMQHSQILLWDACRATLPLTYCPVFVWTQKSNSGSTQSLKKKYLGLKTLKQQNKAKTNNNK